MDNRPIGVFDSGIGGLTAALTLRRLMPGERIIYFGDTGRMPYGGRSTKELMTIAEQNIGFLLGLNAKLILVACGTLSTVALPQMSDTAPVPVIGVVEPAARAAAGATASGRVGIIATAATISGGAYRQAILKLRPDAEIFEAACPGFVPLIESGRVSKDDPQLRAAIEEYLRGIRDGGVDTLLLGCTHYPPISAALSEFLGGGVSMVGAGEAAAAELEKHMDANDLSDGSSGGISFITSGRAEVFARTARVVFGEELKGEISEVEPLPL